LADFFRLITPDAVVIYPRRGKLLLLATGAAMFLCSGFWTWTTRELDKAVISALSISFFGPCLGYAIFRLVRRTPSLIISQSGLYDGSSALGGFVFHWSEIECAYVSFVGRQKMLSIKLKNQEEFLSRVGWVKRIWMRYSIYLVGSPVSISAITLPIKLEELAELIHRHAPEIPIHQ
jgi:hypothetical protein